MTRSFKLIIVAALTLLALLVPSLAGAQERTRCFPETGFCVRGALLDYWERNGGLAVFGYPIGAEIPNENVEDTFVGRTQWFQRDRLEVHADGVMAGRLGARILELQGRPWETLERVSAAPGSCEWFAPTGHSLCEPFLSYWRKNGGLVRFGYPVSEPMAETIGDWRGTVQYFERRRMEHHVENRGTAYEVLLGLLGSEVSRIAPPVLCTTPPLGSISTIVAAYPGVSERLGCPVASWSGVAAASQPFENGRMIWADLGAQGKYIFKYNNSLYAPGRPLTWQLISDTWNEGQPADTGYAAPSGLYAPTRGFGKAWAGSKFVRQDLGWATAPEQADRADVQRYSSGAYVLRLDSGSVVYFGSTMDFVGVLR
ncbi:MAG TPA: hypothetical protein VFS21_24925 [Roseiflexaceae bacterium]|nr:hypothetical protein [Roseiflexaceae bacterium]